MRPHTIIHNSVSLDGSVVGFEVDMAAHYRIAGTFKAQAHLVGSGTALAGIEMFGGLREETGEDLHRPLDNHATPWVLVDSQGRLLDKLHAFRNSEFGGDPIVLVGADTPAAYLDYLKARGYRHHVAGRQRVDLKEGLALLAREYGVETLLVDAGPGLIGALLERRLIDRISLLVMPALLGAKPLRLFDRLGSGVKLELIGQVFME